MNSNCICYYCKKAYTVQCNLYSTSSFNDTIKCDSFVPIISDILKARVRMTAILHWEYITHAPMSTATKLQLEVSRVSDIMLRLLKDYRAKVPRRFLIQHLETDL
jgi:hypothetical protein